MSASVDASATPPMQNPKKISALHRFWNSFVRYFSQPANLILVLMAIALLFFTIYPLVSLLRSTFSVSISEIVFPGVQLGKPTTLWWQRIFASDMSTIYFWRPLGNSLYMSVLASLIAILYGGIVAFLITRTNLKGKKFLSSIFVFPYIMPSWTLATLALCLAPLS